MQRITVSEAERDSSGLIDQFCTQGVSIELERDNKGIARLTPAGPTSPLKVRDLNKFLESLPKLGDNEARRNRRSAFVEAIIGGMYVVNLTTDVARVHAEIYANLTSRGELIGAHDLIIAATARYHDLWLLTDNIDEFSRVSGLGVIPFAP